MGFYSVTFTSDEKGKEPIELLFPTSIVKNLFPKDKKFTTVELIKTIAEAIRKCGERLIETGQPEAIESMCDNCTEASRKVAFAAIAGKKITYTVTESGDFLENMKNLAKQQE